MPALNDPNQCLIDRLLSLRELRESKGAAGECPSASREEPGWVHTAAPCRGAAVSPEVLKQQDGWHFNDHGDGTGVVYWWPPHDAPDRERILRDGITALPVQRLGTVAAPTVKDTPLQPAVSTHQLRNSGRIVTEDLFVPGLSEAQAAPNVSSPTQSPERLYIEVEEGFAARIQRRLTSEGLQARDVGGGGDCFFRALAAQHPDLMRNPELHLRARRRTVEYLRANKEKFFHAVASDYTAYLERMGQAGTWIEGEVELLAAVGAWNVNIHVWGEDAAHDKHFHTPSPDIYTRDVYMVHYRDEHYRIVEKAVG